MTSNGWAVTATVRFTDGSFGEHDFSSMVADPGEIVAPLRDPDYFARVFLECGAPTWPNGFDIAPRWLQMEMEAAGERRRDAACAWTVSVSKAAERGEPTQPGSSPAKRGRGTAEGGGGGKPSHGVSVDDVADPSLSPRPAAGSSKR